MISGSNITVFTPILQTTQLGIVIITHISEPWNKSESAEFCHCQRLQCLQEIQEFAINNIYLKQHKEWFGKG